MIMTMFATSIKFVKLVNMIILRFLRFLGFLAKYTLSDKNSADIIFGGQKYSADKIFGTKLKFRQFCPPNYFPKTTARLHVIFLYNVILQCVTIFLMFSRNIFGGQNFRRTKIFGGQNFRHQVKFSALLSAEFLSNKVYPCPF